MELQKRRKYQFLIPAGKEIIHWADTLAQFAENVRHKREFEPATAQFFDDAVRVRVIDCATGNADDFYISELL